MTASGIYRGTVQRVHPGGTVDVLVRRLGAEHVFGPCDVVEGPPTPGLLTGATDHAHTLRPVAAQLAAGDRVVVALFEGDPNRPVVLGRLAT